MKRIYLIQYNLSDSSAFEGRVKSLGPWVKYFSDNWIVESNLDAKEIYEKLSQGNGEKSIFIIELEPSNFYGRMNTKLWDYLKPRRAAKVKKK